MRGMKISCGQGREGDMIMFSQDTRARRKEGTRRDGSSFSEAEIQAVWNKGVVVPGHDPAVWRKDTCGDWMSRSHYGDTNSQYGWEIDHIVPVSKGGADTIDNLQPLQWENNRSKGDSLNLVCARRA